MIDALGLEVAAIRKRGNGTRIEVRGGERIGQAEDNWLYRFPVEEDLNLRDETPVRLVCGYRETSGVLVSFRDGVLVVAVQADLGPKIAFARLVADDSFLVERLKERLEKVRSGEAQFNKASAERVIGEASIRVGDTDPEPVVLQRGGSLNEDQHTAIRRSLGSDTTYVWGPPGTGKTTTLARIVEAHYRAGRSVLLVSNTNIAVDTALEKVAERLKGEPGFYQGAVLRQGPVVKDELLAQFGPQVILEKVVARLGETLRSEKENLQQEVAALQHTEQPLARAVADHLHLEEVSRSLAEIEASLASTHQSLQTRKAAAEEQHERSARLRADLERARTMGALRRFFTGLYPEQLEREIASAERAGQGERDAARALTEMERTLEASLHERQRECERLTQSMRLYPALAECQKQLKAVREKLGAARERIAAIDRELAALTDEVLGHCRILATTVYRTYLGRQKTRSFDVAVIDEASMLMLPLTYYAAGLATHAVIVAGDFRQLPPIVTSDEAAAEEWLKCDVFEKAGIPEKLDRHAATPGMVALRTQYRMREPICAWVNERFYGGKLRTHPSIRNRPSNFPLGNSPLLYVDTSSFHPWAALRLGTHSRYNLLHALLVRNIVLSLADSGYLPSKDTPGDAVGVVSPYGAQSRLIQAMLKGLTGIAATVHRFQGNEKNAMILDLTDSFGAPLGRFLKATDIKEDGARLLNVAVSRARHHAVLVANFDYLRAKARAGTIVRHLIDHFIENGEALDVKPLLPFADNDLSDVLHYITPPSFELPRGAVGVFTEGTFYPAFAQDLKGAETSIVVFSPFATARGTSRWVEHLRGALARGVAVRVVMKPPGEFGGASGDEVTELVNNLRALGVVVDLRARMHEKIAIIDGQALWHGSLNIFSHNDTFESMLRIECEAACETVGRFVSSPNGKTNDRPNLGASENPACPACGWPMIWNNGRFGIWFTCAKPGCDGKVDPRRRSQGTPRSKNGAQATRKPVTKDTGRKCPRSGGQLVQRSGKYGPFIGCSHYPRCRYTEKLGTKTRSLFDQLD